MHVKSKNAAATKLGLMVARNLSLCVHHACHYSNLLKNSLFNKMCSWRHNMPPPPASWQYLHIYSPGGGAVLACWLFKTSATSLPLTFWPWNWCLSHIWCGLPLPVPIFSLLRPLYSRIRPDVCDRHQTDVRQKHHLVPPPYGDSHNNWVMLYVASFMLMCCLRNLPSVLWRCLLSDRKGIQYVKRLSVGMLVVVRI